MYRSTDLRKTISWQHVVTIIIGLSVLIAATGLSDQVDKQAWYAEAAAKTGTEYPMAEGDYSCWPTTFGAMQSENLQATFTSFGSFGTGFYPGLAANDSGEPNRSFMAPANSMVEYLFGGAIWIGGVVGNDTLVSTGADGWSGPGSEFHPPAWPDTGSVTRTANIGDYSLRTRFLDTLTEGVPNDFSGRPHISLPVEVTLRSHMWYHPDYDQIVVYDMVIRNIGAVPIEDVFVGFYMDADVGYNRDGFFTDDVAGLGVEGEAICYVIDDDGDLDNPPTSPRIFACKLLETSFSVSSTNYNWWISNGAAAFDFGPRQKGTPEDPFRDFGTGGIGTPEGDANKYYILSHTEWDYDQIFTAWIQPTDPIWLYPPQGLAQDFSDGFDARFLMSVGSFNLVPGQTERILFTTFTADDVHVVPGNATNLPDNPEIYLSNLNFDNVLANAGRAIALADSVMNPENPVTGLRVVSQTETEVTVAWDPWVFGDGTGYEVYLWEVPPGDLPYPGVSPSFLVPDVLQLEASLEVNQYSYTCTGLNPNRFYLVNVAHRSSTVGSEGEVLAIRSGDYPAAPIVLDEFIFALEGDPITLQWEAPPEYTVDHYNVYRMDSVLAAAKYRSFYDRGCRSWQIPPADSVYAPHAEGDYWYYYALEVFEQVAGSSLEIVDLNPADDGVYFVTAVDPEGFESHFSNEATVHIIEPRTREILVLMSANEQQDFVTVDSIASFYESTLYGYDWDIYNVADSTGGLGGPGLDFPCLDWHQFMRYDLVIVDQGITDNRVMRAECEHSVRGFERYLKAGGRIAYFGNFANFNGFGLTTTPQYYQSVDDMFVNKFFGIDEVFFAGAGYCYYTTGIPCSDEITGLSLAEGVGMPNLEFDDERDPFTNVLQMFWPSTSPPAVSTFLAGENGTVTHWFRSLYPEASLVEGDAVGIRTVGEDTETYLFGFHLWYMQPAHARELIQSLVGEPAGCCVLRGDFNHDGVVDISDVVDWVDWAFVVPPGEAPGCAEEVEPESFYYSEIDCDNNGQVDIADLVYWVSWSFDSPAGPEPVACE